MSFFSLGPVDDLLKQYGYATVFVGILLESSGAPLPGESLMIATAIYAATTHKLDILLVVPIAAAGAICGDQLGYFIGRSIGFRLLARWGQRIGLSDERLQLGRYLFRRYGGRVVFLGRFIALLRTFVALLAGANHMPWHSFLLWNALGGVAWTCLYGFGAYLLGAAAKQISGPAGIALAVLGAAALIFVFRFVKRNEQRLMQEAQKQSQGRSPRPAAA